MEYLFQDAYMHILYIYLYKRKKHLKKRTGEPWQRQKHDKLERESLGNAKSTEKLKRESLAAPRA